MYRTTDFWQSVGRRGALRIRHHSIISMSEAEFTHPGSVFCSIVDYANWLDKLDISKRAKYLTRLRGRHFIAAAQRIIRIKKARQQGLLYLDGFKQGIQEHTSVNFFMLSIMGKPNAN